MNASARRGGKCGVLFASRRAYRMIARRSDVRLRFSAAASIVLASGILFSANAQVPAASSSGGSTHKPAKPATSAAAAELPLIDLDGYKKILATYKGKPLV